jgi:ABC-type sugar transport system ATPase subunit
MMARKGSTVLWVSSDLLEVSQVADRIMVLRDGGVGTILGAHERDKFTEDALLSLMQRTQFQ